MGNVAVQSSPCRRGTVGEASRRGRPISDGDGVALLSRYECDGCGACCGAYLIFASASDAAREPRIADEGRRLADHLATPQWTYQLHPLPFHSSCCFLDESNRCTIY